MASKLLKEFDYVNGLGLPKRLCVYEMENGKYPVYLWEMRHGEFAGSGNLTPKELKAYLAHFGIKEGLE